ncbi:MAG: 50S ribosomal protein L4 [Candidatus Geothermincolia bacterium]
MQVPIFDRAGTKTGDAELPEEFFASEVSIPAMHQVVRLQLALTRSGTADTKGRSEVRGGGKKPWRQKGTGRARAGSIRSPIWRGGGTVFGPEPRDYGFKVNRKVKRLALRSALSARAGEGRVTVVQDLELEQPSTREAVSLIQALGLQGKVLLVLGNDNENVELSFRNLGTATALPLQLLNTYDILAAENLVLTEGALAGLKERASDETRA